MPHFEIAHLNEQGQDMVIIPLEDSFDHRSDREQQSTVDELQLRSSAAGLKGIVVPVWNSGDRMRFIAPIKWHAFFQDMSMPSVQARLNKTLSW